MKLNEKCEKLVADQATKGTPIDLANARARVKEYFKDQGQTQPVENDPNHVYGFVFGMVPMMNFMAGISKHNATAKFDEQVTAIRIYRAKQTIDGVLTQDLVLAPIKRNGEDYPESVPMFGEENYLAGSGPCPNVCSQLFLTSK